MGAGEVRTCWFPGTLEAEPTGCSGGRLEELGGQQQADSWVAGLRNRKRGAALVGCREAIWEVGFGVVRSQLGHVKLPRPVEQLGACGQWALESQQSLSWSSSRKPTVF